MLPARLLARFALCVALAAAPAVLAQSGVRVPERGEPGLDPSFARGWLAPDYDRFGFAYYAPYQWREAAGFTPGSRMRWSYDFGGRGSLGMGLANGMYLEQDRQVSLFGGYLFSPSWSLNAEMSRDTAGIRPPDFRIGVQRRF
jgi:hypothetical protein